MDHRITGQQEIAVTALDIEFSVVDNNGTKSTGTALDQIGIPDHGAIPDARLQILVPTTVAKPKLTVCALRFMLMLHVITTKHFTDNITLQSSLQVPNQTN